MDFDLIQLIEDDDDDRLLEISTPAQQSATPEPAGLSQPQQPPAPQPLPAVASVSVIQPHRPGVPTQPPTYGEASRPPNSRPIVGCLRISLLSVSVIFVLVSVFAITMNVVGILYCSRFAHIGYGIWTPALVINAAIKLCAILGLCIKWEIGSQCLMGTEVPFYFFFLG